MLPYISLFGIKVPMYGVCVALGILISSYIGIRRTKKMGGDENDLIVIAACAIGLALAGAKLLYILVTYGLAGAFQQIASGQFDILAESGFVFYGGLIGGIAGGFLGAWITHADIATYCDIAVPCVALGHAFGRIGCFFAGCCYGMPYEGPFCITIPHAGIDHPTFPVQLLEVLLNLGIFACLSAFTRKAHRRYQTLYLYLLMYAVVRFGLEFLRGDLVRGIANGFSTSQWISMALFAISGCCLLFPAAGRKARA